MNAKVYYMGIDNGSSKIKCAIYNEEGKEISWASITPETLQPRPGYVERNPEQIWKDNCAVISLALNKAKIRPEQIASISLCGYGSGLCFLGDSLKALGNIIVSTDRRAENELNEMYLNGRANKIFQINHQKPWASQPAPLLEWFRLHEPKYLSQARTALAVKDYIRFRLTGELATDLTDASNNALVSPESNGFCDTLFTVSGIENSRHLFQYPILRPESIAGYVTTEAAEETGLKSGIPVAAGLYDVSACTIGCGCLDAKALAVTIGTWAMAAFIASNYSQTDESTIVTRSALDSQYLLEQGSATGTINLDWYLKQFIKKSHPEQTASELYQYCSSIIRSTRPQQSDSLFVPYLFDSSTNPNAKAAFFHLSSEHTENSLLYAVMEGILLSAARHIRLLQGEKNTFSRIVLSGGVASSPEWSQMFCDLMQIPMDIMEDSQQGTKGAALCSAVAIGTFQNFKEAADAMIRSSIHLMPRQKLAALYERKQEQYEKALQTLNEYYK